MRRWILAAAIAVMGTAGSAATTDWSSLLVFGDSLSDSGNFFGTTQTNGQTWAGQLGAAPWLGGGTNFAYGGAQAVSNFGFGDGQDIVPDFAEQRAFYAAAQSPLGPDPLTLGPNPLTVAWFGGIDLLRITDPASAPATIAGAVGAIGAGVADLAQSFGLTRFILPNLPDLSRIPANLGRPPLERAGVALATALFNDGLAQAAAGLRATGLDVKIFDTAGIFDTILADPGAYGFDPDKVGLTCRGTMSCDGFIFWDPIHPTAATHALIAEGIRELAHPAPVPLPATIWLLAGALGGVVAVGRRRAA